MKKLLLNIDCMDYMKTVSDGYFDLAVVDPPYFKGAGNPQYYNSTKAPASRKPIIDTWQIPGPDYFKELFRISKDQIIWGCNYFAQNIPHSARIVWYKHTTGDFSDAELASYSQHKRVVVYEFKWNGMQQGDMKNKEKRIHPTQKPVCLYEWIFRNYAKPGFSILDTHLGSASSAIAAYYAQMGEFVGCELDRDYYLRACERFEQQTKQEILLI